ncbi:MAG: NUDIX domain-containing protein [Patescibacteria group bacterium]
MTNLPGEIFHVGVYGILINESRILLIKKSRGAYKGMLDLPGGGIEFGEKIEEALKREFIEETGIRLDNYSFLGNQEYFREYTNESGEPRKLHHLGLYYKVSAPLQDVKNGPDGQDSLGAVFIEIAKLYQTEITPIAKSAIETLLKSCAN